MSRHAPDLISIDSELGLPSQIESRGDNLFLLYRRAKTLMVCSNQGAILARYDKVGGGPECLVQPMRMAVTEERLLVVDLRKQSILSFDHALQFQQIQAGMGMCRDILSLDGDLYVLVYRPERGTMITRYSSTFEEKGAFGSPVSAGVGFGMQAGSMTSDGTYLYFMHTFRPSIEKFLPDGTLVATLRIPGYPETFFDKLDLTQPNYWNHVTHRAVGLRGRPGGVVALVVDLEKEQVVHIPLWTARGSHRGQAGWRPCCGPSLTNSPKQTTNLSSPNLKWKAGSSQPKRETDSAVTGLKQAGGIFYPRFRPPRSAFP